MSAIWFIVAIMIGAALSALLLPLSRRQKPAPEAVSRAGLATETGFYEDQLAEIDRDLARGLIAESEAEAARTEAARRLLRANREGRTGESALEEPRLRQRRAASAFALSTIPLVALIAYGLYGSPTLPSQTEADRQATRSRGQDVMKVIAQIEERLARNPDDARGWKVIAPVYMRLGRFADAARAYETVIRLQGEDAEMFANAGEALVVAEEGQVSEQAYKRFEQALALDPSMAKPQFYLARHDELAGDLPGAIRRLEALVRQGPADAPWMQLVQSGLARLKASPAPSAPPEAGITTPGRNAEAAKPGAGAGLQSLPPEQMAAIRGMVDGLDRRLTEKGGNVEEWVRLVRSYRALGDRDRALAALERGRRALAGNAGDLDRLDAEAAQLGLGADVGRQGKTDIAPHDLDVTTTQSGADLPSGPDLAAAAIKAMSLAERQEAIRSMVERLDRRLAHRGGSLDEWVRLVHSYSALGDQGDAVGALERARMALATEPRAAARLDALGRELDLVDKP